MAELIFPALCLKKKFIHICFFCLTYYGTYDIIAK